jgi:hypothetical protein
MDSHVSDEVYRADAALVYRYIRDHGGATIPEMSDEVFGDVSEASVTRVLNAIVWMRHQKVVMTAVPGMVGLRLSTFHLGAVEIDASKVSRSVRGFEGVEVVEVVTDKVSQPEKAVFSDAMDLYHPK